jgi:hypothetical protein
MGYQVTTVTPAKTQPMAAAELPSMMILPAVAFMRSTRQRSVLVRLERANSWPASTAFQFSSAARCFFAPNWRKSAVFTSSRSRPNNCAATPS